MNKHGVTVGIVFAGLLGIGAHFGCGDAAGTGGAAGEGGGDGGGRIACDDTSDCPNVECPCFNGPKMYGGNCEDTDRDGLEDSCLDRRSICANYDCPLDATTAATNGAATNGAATTGVTNGGANGTSAGSGTTTHPECIGHTDGQCVCGVNSQCSPDQYAEMLDFCNSFFDTPFMQCSIACVAAGGTCTEKSECINGCE
jgi:hypothetical protein